MSLVESVNNVMMESVNVPALEKIILGATEEDTGLTTDELKKLSKVLPQKLKGFRQSEAIAAIDAILLNPTKGLKPRKKPAEQVVDDEINELIK